MQFRLRLLDQCFRLNQLLAKESTTQKKSPGTLEHFVKNIGLKKHDKMVWVSSRSKQIFSNQFSNVNLDVKSIKYYLLMNSLIELIKKNKANLLLVDLATYQEVLGLIKRLEKFKFRSETKYLKLHKVHSQFQNKNLIPLYFPMDNHFTPAGHFLTAILVFNHMIANQMIPHLKMDDSLIDIKNQKIIKQVRQANHRITYKLKNLIEMPLNEAYIFRNRGRFDLAISSLVRYLEKSNGNLINDNHLELLLFELSLILLKENKFKEASLFLEAISSLNGRFHKNVNNILSSNYLHNGNKKMAQFYKNSGSVNGN